MLFLLAAIIVIGVLIYISMYNNLINLKNQVDNVYSTIDVLLKKRHDLIPNLVASVQQYMVHEHDTLTQIAEMRSKAMSPNLTPDQRVDVENQITKGLGNIMVAVENYPNLKANENFLQLQASLNEVEEQISAARRAYNASVTALNNAVEMFPSSLIATSMNLQKRQWFEAPAAEREAPDVKAAFAR